MAEREKSRTFDATYIMEAGGGGGGGGRQRGRQRIEYKFNAHIGVEYGEAVRVSLPGILLRGLSPVLVRKCIICLCRIHRESLIYPNFGGDYLRSMVLA